MRTVTIPLPELAAIAATRAIGAAGASLLLADRVAPPRRRRLGWIMLGIGLATTLPLVLNIARRTESERADALARVCAD